MTVNMKSIESPTPNQESIPQLDIKSLRELAGRQARLIAEAEALLKAAIQRSRDELELAAARKKIAQLPKTLYVAALAGEARVVLHLLCAEECALSAPKPEELSGVAKFIWESCAEYQPVIDVTYVYPEHEPSETWYAIQILLRPNS
jgi:hypothetical protein